MARKLTSIEGGNAEIEEIPIADYSTNELKEIVLNPEDWHEEFIRKSKEELNLRGIEVEAAEVESVHQEKIRELEQGTEPSKTLFYFMWGFAIFGGYIGIIAGFFYWRGKVKGIDGKRYFMYTPKYRKHGSYIFVVGLLSALLQTYLLLYY